MEKICATPLVEFDIYNAFEIQVLRGKIRDMQSEATAKILEMYKEIITYLVIVYEGFESFISQVSYLLRQCYKNMNNEVCTYHNLNILYKQTNSLTNLSKLHSK